MNSFINLLNTYGITDDAVHKLVSIISTYHIKKHEELVLPNQICNHIYFIIDGGFICQHWNKNFDNPRTVNFYLKDFQPFMTCVESYFNETPCEFSIKAVLDSEIIAFQKDKLSSVLNESLHFNVFYSQMLENALVAENDFRVKLLTLSPEDLYNYILQKYPQIPMYIPSKYIAEFIGISPEWLSKIKRKSSFS